MPSFMPSEELPVTPVAPADFIQHLVTSPASVRETLAPFLIYEDKLRSAFAQQPNHAAVQDPTAGLVPIFNGHEDKLKIRARDLDKETTEEKERYLMPLDEDARKDDGANAIVTLEAFKKNFSVFSEGALANLDWSNIVASGSSVLTPLLPVPEEYSDSKRSLRTWYHEKIAPTSDVDLFIYGITDESEAIARMEKIEATIKDNLLWEVTSVRTKNTITVVSQYPNRHIQIVLRLYKSISEILTGFDVNCACVAYDGTQVYANPRAIASWVTQCNDVDISRRSPSYEHRLAKYKSRGFEAYYPLLERARIDPTIYERAFGRLKGLARLLVLERLPQSDQRDTYLDARRLERGRPAKQSFARKKILRGDLKIEGEVPDYEFAVEESSYETFHIPYGQGHNAKRTERLMYQKDMLLNAEWNKQAQKDRDAYLHRHPVFFGDVKDIKEDCCGFCPVATNTEEVELQAYDDKTFVRGNITFLKDDPGRQEVGSFTPITETDWTEMAYIGDNELLCKAIVANDVEAVKLWASQDGHEINRRDCTGRTPLHLASWCSTYKIVKTLIDRGARLVARMADGRTALHLAAARGETEMVRALLQKSEENEALRDEKEDAKKKVAKEGEAVKEKVEVVTQNEEEEDFEEINSDEGSDLSINTGTNSVVEVKVKKEAEGGIPEDAEEDDDIYDVNVLDWDFHFAPLHHAILGGHAETVKVLVSDFGADAILPVKLLNDYDGSPMAAILTLALLHKLPIPEQRALMADTLLSLGATATQADLNKGTAFHWAVHSTNGEVLDVFFNKDNAAVKSVINHMATPPSNSYRNNWDNPLTTAIKSNEDLALQLLGNGAKGDVTFEMYMKNFPNRWNQTSEALFATFQNEMTQPIELALENEAVNVFIRILEMGIDPSLMSKETFKNVINNTYNPDRSNGSTLLDLVRRKIVTINKVLEDVSSVVDEEVRALKRQIEVESHEDLPASVLDQFPVGSYERWSAETTWKVENKARADWRKDDANPREKRPFLPVEDEDEDLKALKYTRLLELKEKLEKAESVLLEKGAKTFAEVRPDLAATKTALDTNIPTTTEKETKEKLLESLEKLKEPYKFTITYNNANLIETANDAYLRLFKAAWDGDVPTIKTLTLAKWGGEGEDAKDPLLITATDKHNMNPFFIAILNNQSEEVLRAILDIARAQYAPETMKEKFYSQEAYCSDDEDSYDHYEDEDHDYNGIISRLIDHEFTIDVVAELAKTAKSTISDIAMMSVIARASALDYGRDGIPESFTLNALLSPLSLAVCRNDEKLASFLLNVAAKAGEGEVEKLVNIQNAFASVTSHLSPPEIALKHGRFGILSEIIRLTGIGGDFFNIDQEEDEADASQLKLPRAYTGLSVHGKKRKDWAQSANPDAVYNSRLSPIPPMMCWAVGNGNLTAAAWLETDEPVNAMVAFGRYLEKHDPHDKRISKIKKADSKTISQWFGVDHPQLVHAAIIGSSAQTLLPEEKEIMGTVDYLFEKYPNLKNARCGVSGITPLLLAASLAKPVVVANLLEHGCDPRLKDTATSRNIVHHALMKLKSDAVKQDVELVEKTLALLPEDVKQWAFTNRAETMASKIAETPLGYYLQVSGAWSTNHYGFRNRHGHGSFNTSTAKMVRTILKHSKGADLVIRNGVGDLPLHVAVKQGNPDIVQLLLDETPEEMLLMENANGMSILDLVQDKYLQNITTRNWDILENKRENDWAHLVSYMRTTKEEEKEDIGRVNYEQTRSIVLEKLGKRESKRKLVSLWEANETAKRLAGRQKREVARVWRKQRDENEGKMQQKGVDVVNDWVNLY